MNLCIVGLGYVGLSNLALFSNDHNVVGIDSNKYVIKSLELGNIHLAEFGIKDQIEKNLDKIHFLNDLKKVDKAIDFFIVSVPTNYDHLNDHFDTTIIDSVICEISKSHKNSIIVIRSTIPVGYTERIKKITKNRNIVFVPEFLREGAAYLDSIEPSRLIIGSNSIDCAKISDLYLQSIKKKDVEILHMSSEEAESVKLFSNTYLAMRVAYINEIDNFCMFKNLDAELIIRGISLDPRIGHGYNNPSFGYGGYCLPKDTLQTSAMCKQLPNSLINNIDESNHNRAKYIAKSICRLGLKKIGIYKIAMKAGSDNYRSSSILNVVAELRKNSDIDVIIFDDSIDKSFMSDIRVDDFNTFINQSDIILTNRIDPEILKYKSKIFSRDLFGVS